MSLLETQFLVLKRIPYRESDWILTGISPDAGKLSLIICGGRKSEGKNFPEADLFREFDVEYSISENGEMGNVRSMELIADSSGIADDPVAFKFAGAVGAFVLANSVPELGMPVSYDVLRNIMVNFAAGGDIRIWSMEEASALFKLTWLTESGMLPDPGKNAEFLESVIDCGVNGEAMPQVRAGYWQELGKYLNGIIKKSKLQWN